MKECDYAITNGRLVNVMNATVHDVDILVDDGLVARIGPRKSGQKAAKTFDAEGRYVLPGLIDAHTHYEMSMLSAVPFAEAVVPQGTTAAMIDPHDIVNVMGMRGLMLLAEEARKTPLKAFFMVPPCVPSSPKLEDAGAAVTLADVKQGMECDLAWGIAETMDFVRVLEREPELMKILGWARERGLRVDGHCPELRGDDLQAYVASGPVLTDHESTSVEEMREKLALGMRVIIRRGSLSEPASAAEFVNSLKDTSNVMLATDGCITVGDMMSKGHMNYALRCIVEEGVDPITAVQMATINVARSYGLERRLGVVSPGRVADLLVVESLERFEVAAVFVDGTPVPPLGSLSLQRYSYPNEAVETVILPPAQTSDFVMRTSTKQGSTRVRVIRVVDGTLATEADEQEIPVGEGLLAADPTSDLLKVAVLQRYGKEGAQRSLGFVRGFGLKAGAYGGSVGQDAQNVVVVGASDEDMALVVNTIREHHGALVVAAGGRVLDCLPLPIAGIMTSLEPQKVMESVRKIDRSLAQLGCSLSNPFLSLSLQLTLAVIPELKITNRGLVDAGKGLLVPLELEG